MSVLRSRWLIAGIAVALVAVLLGGQTATDRLTPTRTPAGQELGRAGVAYLSGLRIFAAYVLWNRIEPIFHEYYEDVPLAEQTYTLPTVGLVLALDPQFEDGYYTVAWVLARRGDVAGGLDLAKKGIENNPESGFLRANYAQILWLYGKDVPEAVRQVDEAVRVGKWRNAIDQHDSYAVFGAIYRAAGLKDKDAFIKREILRLDVEIGPALDSTGHDHDGDGKPDH
ncbi:MAG: hypothetical protein Q8K99_07635 [Actinomycetota bacterium]|nr:hypothetical protein [Actinomycetota bacterium]